MGLTFSTPLNEDQISNQINLKNIANAKVSENNILDTLNISDIIDSERIPIPLIGGKEDLTSEGEFAYNFPQKKLNKKDRFNNYDLFSTIANLESKNKKGGNMPNNKIKREELSQSSSSQNGMEAIKELIVEEINKYNKNKNITGGGDCGCSGDKNILKNQNNVLEGGKKKKKKVKKTKKVMKGGISSSSESSSTNYKLNREDVVSTTNEELEDEQGLSIFPLNSSDVSNQTSSERNFRMIRRKV
jgi:hypothetical protein